MTPNEIQLLAVGFALGGWTVAIWQMVLDVRQAERNLARSEEARRRAAAARFLAGFRLYRIQNRPRAAEPHPAEVLEASVRDLELKVYDGLDRVEDAARRDGLL
ncbi:hypothetical protein ACH4C6_14130 [Streptomyces sp. NPDC017943]|uniref:hypothetical protein n=1 Tax=Streptomyces sp. NPDC017943 TaxID=3365019 RepID=UPI0037881240